MQVVSDVVSMPEVEEITFRAGRAELVGTLYRPAGRPRAAMVLHGATGVPQHFYSKFATWLAETQNIACLTYDYSDFGRSLKGDIRLSRVTMFDWGARDQPAAQAALAIRFPNAPLWVMGHSLGGFMVPFHEGAGRIDRLITVASGPVHVSDHPWSYWFQAQAFWNGPVPLLTKLMGYVPGEKFKFGANLPASVYWQWRRWCTTKGFILSEIGSTLPMPDWNAMKAPMRIVAIEDDPLVPPHTVWRLMQYYPQARKVQYTLRPKASGLGKVGHLGVFSRRNAAAWPMLIAE